jgi:hypothetical protein
MTQEKEDFLLYGHRMTEWERIRPLAQRTAYFDPKTKMAYSHIDYLAEDVRRRLLQKQAFESHSQRAYLIVEETEVNEYKGLRELPVNNLPILIIIIDTDFTDLHRCYPKVLKNY